MNNKTLFTPGHWTVRRSESNPAYNVVGTNLGKKWKIARCPFVDEFDKAEAEANAKLIAAAPDMYEALFNLNQAIDDYWNSDTKPDILVRHINMKQKMAEAALTKAQGGI